MSSWVRQTAVFVLLLSVGCANVGQSWKFTRVFRHSDPPESAREEDDSTTVEDEQDEPLPAPLVAAKNHPPVRRHDPATNNFIEEELRDATPEERKEFLTYLESIDSAEVPNILQARRMAKRRQEEMIATADTSADAARLGHSGARQSETPPANGSGTQPGGRHSGLEAPEPASGLGWPKRIKQPFADSNWLWPNAPSEEEGVVPAEAVRAERNPIRLPQILGNRARGEAPQNAPVAEAAHAEPEPRPLPQTPFNDVRLTPGSALWEDEMHKLISLLETETSAFANTAGGAASRNDIREQVALRMLYLIAGEPAKAQQAIPGLTPPEQEFWTTLFVGLADNLDQQGVLDPDERATRTISQLRDATHQLQRAAKLQLRNVTCCEGIQGFGSYDPVPMNVFQPGQALLIYAEIRNFSSEPTVDGHYRTSIKSNVEIFRTGAENELVDQSQFDATEDLSRTIRSDYYHSYRIDLPLDLAPGSYLLKLTIQDEATSKMATQTISFSVQ